MLGQKQIDDIILERKELFELDKKGPYHRYFEFPVQINAFIEVNRDSTLSNQQDTPIVAGSGTFGWYSGIIEVGSGCFPVGSRDISENSEASKVKMCTCDMMDLMKSGCSCGGI